MLTPRRLSGAAALLAWLAAAPTAAQDSAPPEAPAPQEQVTPAEPAPLTEEEQRALEQALGADADAADSAPQPAQTSQSSGVGRLLQSMNPDMSLILDTALSGFTGEPMQLGAHDPNRNGFTLQQLELHVESNVDPYFNFQANIVFAQFGVEVEEVYAQTLALPANLQLRAGQFLTRMGRLNPTHPHSWHFVDQPIVNGKFFGGEGSRGLGAEASWLAPLPWFMEASLAANMADGECCARSFYGAQDLGVDGLADLVYTGRIEQFFGLGPDWSLLSGLSAQLGPNPTGQGNRTEIYAADLYLRWRPTNSTTRESLSLQIEGMWRRRQIPQDVLADWGGYAQLVWQPHFQWEIGARYERVSGLANDPLDPQWTSARQRTSLQGTFYPSHFSRLRLQLAHDDPTWRDDPSFAAMLALEVLVGEHGSHNF